MKIPKVAIGIPYYESMKPAMFFSSLDLVHRSSGKVMMLPIGCTGAYTEENRNGVVEHAMQMGVDWDWLLWIDTDMKFPGDALLRLLAHDKDIVGANYRQRRPPYKYTGVYADHTDTHLMEPGLHRMKQIATGLLLTRFEIYRHMQREGMEWFPAASPKKAARDDIAFCRQAEALGYEIWCDHDLTKEVAHCGEQEIPWFEPEQIIQRGAQINLAESAQEGRMRAQKTGALLTAADAAN